MDKVMKAKWVEALRSGKYEQTSNQLRDDNSFCCLGVLCEISNEGQWNDDRFVTIFDSSEDFLPRHLITRFDINTSSALVDGLVSRMWNSVSLVDLNDDGFTFAQIADIIDYFL